MTRYSAIWSFRKRWKCLKRFKNGLLVIISIKIIEFLGIQIFMVSISIKSDLAGFEIPESNPKSCRILETKISAGVSTAQSRVSRRWIVSMRLSKTEDTTGGCTRVVEQWIWNIKNETSDCRRGCLLNFENLKSNSKSSKDATNVAPAFPNSFVEVS